jgi:hypothetical protein
MAIVHHDLGGAGHVTMRAALNIRDKAGLHGNGSHDERKKHESDTMDGFHGRDNNRNYLWLQYRNPVFL